MSVTALSRLLEAIAKSIKHASTMSTIFQASVMRFWSRLNYYWRINYELRNAPINSKTLFDNKIKEVAKGNFEAQQ